MSIGRVCMWCWWLWSFPPAQVVVCAAMMAINTPKDNGAAVRIQVRQSLTGVTPSQAKTAWLSHIWKEGGGLPVIVTHSKDESSSTRRRRLLPLNMQETLLDNGSGGSPIQYKVTDMGLLAFDLQQDSHLATVEFVDANKEKGDDSDDLGASTEMVWTVEFQAKHRPELWKKVTELNVQTATSNLALTVATPLLYRQTTRLTPPSNNITAKNDDIDLLNDISKDWIDFVWRQGGGLPILPPIQLDDHRRVYVPPFLVERLVSTKQGEIQYTVDNPGPFTYQVYTHAGRVRFHELTSTTDHSKQVEMEWEVQVRPLKGCAVLVKHFTSAIVSTLARNFQVHVNEPDAMVSVAPPRGRGEAFAEVPKETWLGGVFDAHLSDKRSTWEQTLAILQPWTWGRTTNYDDGGHVGNWTIGYMSE